jgi:hypothetical protein
MPWRSGFGRADIIEAVADLLRLSEQEELVPEFREAAERTKLIEEVLIVAAGYVNLGDLEEEIERIERKKRRKR